MTDDTQDPATDPGCPEIDASAANLGERSNWWTPDGLHEISTGGSEPPRIPFSDAEIRALVKKWLDEQPELYERVWRWLWAVRQSGS